MRRNSKSCPSIRTHRLAAQTLVTMLLAIAAGSLLLQAGDHAPDRIPSYVEWTPETISAASGGDAFRGLLLARHCEHCHGTEGFSHAGSIPNLAGMNRLAIWKQLEDFRTYKRVSWPMNPIAASLAPKDIADLIAYYSKLPVFTDPDDHRVFPQAAPDSVRKGMAWRLINFGDGERGIPPCQSCHGPVGFRPGVPSLATQNGEYLLAQMEDFASGKRSNDINEPMRTIAQLLSDEERHALAEYYGAGLGTQLVTVPTGK